MEIPTIKQIKTRLNFIPESEWIVGRLVDTEEKKCCSIGHIERILSNNPKDYSEKNCSYGYNNTKADNIIDKISSFSHRKVGTGLANINDKNYGVEKTYPQDTPKKRVMALLSDMIKAVY